MTDVFSFTNTSSASSKSLPSLVSEIYGSFESSPATNMYTQPDTNGVVQTSLTPSKRAAESQQQPVDYFDLVHGMINQTATPNPVLLATTQYSSVVKSEPVIYSSPPDSPLNYTANNNNNGNKVIYTQQPQLIGSPTTTDEGSPSLTSQNTVSVYNSPPQYLPNYGLVLDARNPNILPPQAWPVNNDCTLVNNTTNSPLQFNLGRASNTNVSHQQKLPQQIQQQPMAYNNLQQLEQLLQQMKQEPDQLKMSNSLLMSLLQGLNPNNSNIANNGVNNTLSLLPSSPTTTNTTISGEYMSPVQQQQQNSGDSSPLNTPPFSPNSYHSSSPPQPCYDMLAVQQQQPQLQQTSPMTNNQQCTGNTCNTPAPVSMVGGTPIKSTVSHWEIFGAENIKKQCEMNPPITVRSKTVIFEPFNNSSVGRHRACWNLIDPMHRNYYQPIKFMLPSITNNPLIMQQPNTHGSPVDPQHQQLLNLQLLSESESRLHNRYEGYRIYVHQSLGYSGNAKRFKQYPDQNEKALIFDGNVYDGHLNPIHNCKICTEYYQTKSYFSANPHAKGKVLLIKNNILTRVKDGEFTLSLKPMCCSGHNAHIPLYFHFTLTDPNTKEVVLQSLINVNVKQWKKSIPNKNKKLKSEDQEYFLNPQQLNGILPPPPPQQQQMIQQQQQQQQPLDLLSQF